MRPLPKSLVSARARNINGGLRADSLNARGAGSQENRRAREELVWRVDSVGHEKNLFSVLRVDALTGRT
jgi:hypothetical protein